MNAMDEKWDGKAYSSIQKHYQFMYGQKLIEKSLSYLRSYPKSVVDLGCGEGTLTSFLFSALGQQPLFVGVDKDESMIMQAKKQYPDITFEQSNIMDWLLGINQSYDYIFSNAVLHWFKTYDNLAQFFRSVKNKLSDNGIAAFHFSLSSNASIAKDFLYSNLAAYLKREIAESSRCEYEFDKVKELIGKHFDICFEKQIQFFPFENNHINNFHWMVQSQPIMHLLDRDYNDFCSYLYKIWMDNPVNVYAHQCEFIITRKRGE